jgi:phosphoribosylpyrophosphate synthetase
MAVFSPDFADRERLERIVTLGAYLPTDALLSAHGAARYARESGASYAAPAAASAAWTREIVALNAGRKWARRRFFERLDPMLGEGIVVCVVPSHDPFAEDPPIRQLARILAESRDRIDGTRVLERHTKIRRIVYGGPSYRALHRQTITVALPECVSGRSVALLDDIARSGTSLRTCRELLLEAGAAEVQALALGRVTGG